MSGLGPPTPSVRTVRRRDLLRGSAALGVVLAGGGTFAACGRQPVTTAGGPVGPPQRGGHLRVGMVGAGREWAVPFENYRDAVEVAQGSGIDRVITNREPGTVGFLYYDESVEVLQPTEAICTEPAPFVYFDFPVEPEEHDLSCLAERGGRMVQVEQRRAPGSIDVWIVPA